MQAESDLPVPPGSSRPDGLLKTEIRKLVNRRRDVKRLMNDEKPGSDKYQQVFEITLFFIREIIVA